MSHSCKDDIARLSPFFDEYHIGAIRTCPQCGRHFEVCAWSYLGDSGGYRTMFYLEARWVASTISDCGQ